MAVKKYVIGADLGGTTCKLGVFTSEGELLEKWEIRTDRRDNGAFILPNIAEGIEKKLTEMKIKKDGCLGVGIGVPGAVLPGGVVNRCVNLGWDVVPIEAELSKLCGLKVRAANDANIAALGEYWKGGGEGFDSIVMVTLGTGIGGGIVLGGKLLVGQNGAAGEIGHIVVNPEEKIACGCGNHGCIEQYASATGIARAAREELALSDENSVLRSDKGNITAKDVFDAAKAGDSLALRVSNRVLSMLGHTLAVVANTVNPEAFLIGGGVSKAGKFIIDGVRATFERDAFHAVRNTKIVLAKLGNDAGIYGAAYLAIED